MTAWSSVLRGAFTRFIPGVLTFFGGSFLLAATLKGIAIGPHQVFGFASFALAMTAGHVIALGLMRPSLEETAEVDGRRSFLAGLTATFALLGLGMLHAGPTPLWMMNMFGVIAGSGATVAIFFPWLTRGSRPEWDAARQFDDVPQAFVASPELDTRKVVGSPHERVV